MYKNKKKIIKYIYLLVAVVLTNCKLFPKRIIITIIVFITVLVVIIIGTIRIINK